MGHLRSTIKELVPLLVFVHCFNHCIELANKDAFEGMKIFKDIDNMLMKLFYLYQKSPKRYRELKELSEDYEKSIPAPNKVNGRRWIDHKYRECWIIMVHI